MQHRTALTILCLIVQTIIISQMLSTGEEGAASIGQRQQQLYKYVIRTQEQESVRGDWHWQICC